MEKIRSYCVSCKNSTNHDVVFCEIEKSTNEDGLDFIIYYYTLKCSGCENISFRKDFHDHSSYFYNNLGEVEIPITTNIYPPYIHKHKTLDGIWMLPLKIRKIYEESISALKAKCLILSGAGFRGVIEAICLDKTIKGRDLETKINNLAKQGLITKTECDRLHSIRFLGNDSIHEMKEPNKVQLIAVLNIIEHLLNNLYLIDNEFGYALEKPISKYSKFKELIELKISKYNIGDEFPLIKYLGKDKRLVKDKFSEFESQLKVEIESGKYNYLKIGNIKQYSGSNGSVQHYIIKDIPIIEEPF